MPVAPEFDTAIFVDDAAVLATDSDPAIASEKLPTNQDETQNWIKEIIRANKSHSQHEDERAPKSISISISGCILIGELPGPKKFP
jgi:hypothetical protein